MPLTYLLLGAVILVPILIFIDYYDLKRSNKQKRDDNNDSNPDVSVDSLIDGFFVVFPFVSLFYGINFWVNIVYVYALMGYAIGLMLLAAKFNFGKPLDKKWFETYCVGSPVLMLIIYGGLNFFGVYDIDENTIETIKENTPLIIDHVSIDINSDTNVNEDAEDILPYHYYENIKTTLKTTADWIYYSYAGLAFISLFSLAIRNIDVKLYVFILISIVCNTLPFFSESYFWFMLAGTVSFITLIFMAASTFSRDEGAAFGMVIPYFYMMAATGSLMAYGGIWLYKAIFIGIQ